MNPTLWRFVTIRTRGNDLLSSAVSSRDASSATMISGPSAAAPETTSDSKHARVTAARLYAGTMMLASGAATPVAFR
jgi:hypothetical protein